MYGKQYSIARPLASALTLRKQTQRDFLRVIERREQSWCEASTGRKVVAVQHHAVPFWFPAVETYLPTVTQQ